MTILLKFQWIPREIHRFIHTLSLRCAIRPKDSILGGQHSFLEFISTRIRRIRSLSTSICQLWMNWNFPRQTILLSSMLLTRLRLINLRVCLPSKGSVYLRCTRRSRFRISYQEDSKRYKRQGGFFPKLLLSYIVRISVWIPTSLILLSDITIIQ